MLQGPIYPEFFMPITSPREGVEINYEIHGDGPPLILVSGTGHDLGFWAGQIP
jgi:hypothetical protein